MKEKIVNSCMKLITTNNNYNEEKLERIKYGLLSTYMTLTKIIVLTLIAYFLNILTEYFIFLLLFNILRFSGFGLHASKSWMCWISSTIMFIILPFICKYMIISITIKVLLSVLGIILIFKNCPADTHKRPIISKKRREIYKFISTFTAIVFAFLTILLKNNFLSNALILAILLECTLTSPLTYKMFKLPFDNYKNYQVAE